jgi:hypothetical protein
LLKTTKGRKGIRQIRVGEGVDLKLPKTTKEKTPLRKIKVESPQNLHFTNKRELSPNL